MELSTTISNEKGIISGDEWNIRENKLADWIVDMYSFHAEPDDTLDAHTGSSLSWLRMECVFRDTDLTEDLDRYLIM